jgi:hypothetical protein
MLSFQEHLSLRRLLPDPVLLFLHLLFLFFRSGLNIVVKVVIALPLA